MKESKVGNDRIGVYLPDHPGANNRGYVLRYRVRMEEKLGRYLATEEQVHHINGDPTDDRIENLELTTSAEHSKTHKYERRKLDYSWILRLRNEGLGYKKIVKVTGYPRSSIRSACDIMKRG